MPQTGSRSMQPSRRKWFQVLPGREARLRHNERTHDVPRTSWVLLSETKAAHSPQGLFPGSVGTGELDFRFVAREPRLRNIGHAQLTVAVRVEFGLELIQR